MEVGLDVLGVIILNLEKYIFAAKVFIVQFPKIFSGPTIQLNVLRRIATSIIKFYVIVHCNLYRYGLMHSAATLGRSYSLIFAFLLGAYTLEYFVILELVPRSVRHINHA